jgi:hypothetical protein
LKKYSNFHRPNLVSLSASTLGNEIRFGTSAAEGTEFESVVLRKEGAADGQDVIVDQAMFLMTSDKPLAAY